MAKKRRGRGKSNRSPQRWLYMSVYPIALAIIFFGVTIGGWAAEAIQSDPSVTRDFDDRDADDWLEKLGITDTDDPGGIKEAALDDLLDVLGLDISVKDIEKGKLDADELDALGLGDLDPNNITIDDIIDRINELVDQKIAMDNADKEDTSSDDSYEDTDLDSEDATEDDSDEDIDDSDAEEAEDDTDTEESEDDTDTEDTEEDTEEDLDDSEEEIEEEEPEEDFLNYYYYSVCSDSEKQLYKEIYDIFSNRKGYTYVSTSDTDVLNKMYSYVTSDHPELFYVWGWSWRGSGTRVSVKGSYTYSEEELLTNKALNEAAAKQIVDSVPVGLSEYETIRYFYEYLVHNTSYDLGSEWNQEISSVFINHVSVCAGYARAMQYLLQLKGIQALYVTGTAGGPHAWNVVRVDGKYYHLDVCWADPTNEDVPRPDYAYLCIPTDRICVNHTVGEETPIPPCTSMDANFYVQEGYYLESFDTDKIAEIFDKSKIENRGIVYMMAADATTYYAALNYLIDQHNVSDLYFGEGRSGSWRYTQNDELYTLSFYSN